MRQAKHHSITFQELTGCRAAWMKRTGGSRWAVDWTQVHCAHWQQWKPTASWAENSLHCTGVTCTTSTPHLTHYTPSRTLVQLWALQYEKDIDKPEYFWHMTTKIFGAGTPELRETKPGDQIISGGPHRLWILHALENTTRSTNTTKGQLIIIREKREK